MDNYWHCPSRLQEWGFQPIQTFAGIPIQPEPTPAEARRREEEEK